MCGRATLTVPVDEIAAELGVEPIAVGPPRFNIAPGQPIVAVRVHPPKGAGSGLPEMALLKWGLRPFWAKGDGKPKRPFVQSRAETVETNPAFRKAFESRRCLVVVDGFYEWSSPEEGPRRPHHVHLKSHAPFTIAGLWESYHAKDGEIVETCAVVTTEAKGAIRRIHDRMPLVLTGAERERWLTGAPGEAGELLRVTHARDLELTPVSTWVNDVKHDDPRCLDPASPGGGGSPEKGQTALPFK